MNQLSIIITIIGKQNSRFLMTLRGVTGRFPINLPTQMKKEFCLYAICISVCLSFPVHSQTLEVSYKYYHPVQTMRSAVADVENQYILLTDGNSSKFYSPRTEMIDSIESTLEGFEAFNTFKRVCWETGKQREIPKVDGSFYITKSRKTNKIDTYDVASGMFFHFSEPYTMPKWELADSVKNILGYECQMATTRFHGREWTAWFTVEIPVPDGPWKLTGLPGLILEAECEGRQYKFMADGLQQTTKPVTDIYRKGKWDEIKREEFWQLRRECLANPSRNINAAGIVIVFKGVEYKDYLPAEIVDYIETDYR